MVRVTVLGCGRMGENHVRAVADHPTLELESVVDLDEERAESFASQYGANRALTDPAEALDDAEAAVVATPHSAHAEQAHAALDRDCHLLLEKPVATDLDEARTLADRAAGVDATTGVSFILRYDPAYASVREAMANGDLGDPTSVRAKRGLSVAESRRAGARGHPMLYMNIHDIDAMQWCLDADIERVRAVERRGELADLDIPDAIQALYEFADGTVGVLESYGTLPENVPGGIEAALEVLGTDGRATVDTPGSALTIHADHYDRPDTRHWPVINDRQDGAVRRQIDRFADAIASDEDVLATLEDGVRAQEVAVATREAAESGDPQRVDRF